MIVFDLKCSRDHRFEAWFGSSRDYEEQKGRGLVSCPLCDDRRIEKAVMAPAVAAKSNQRPDAAPSVPAVAAGRAVAAMSPADAARLQALVETVARAQAEALAKSAWVGDAFADKARAMHYGDEPQASIHGTADRDEARALMEEGIAVAPLPLPVVPPGERN